MAVTVQKPNQPNQTTPAKPGQPQTPAAGTAPARPTAPVQPLGPIVKRLKKGELLFAEGENSRAMYLLKNGMIRIFKKKGDTNIEIDTIRSGQVLGELAFLDGNPRSASGEALIECELVEISGPTFQAVLSKMPDWLKMLLKTVVGRLRTASTRIRQLETASTAIDYSDKDGGKKGYVFLSPIDVLKIASSLLLVASRNGTRIGGGTDIRVGLLNRYANQIMGIPSAKITTFLDVLAQIGVLTMTDTNGAEKVVLDDVDFVEHFITYLNEENLLEPSKRHDISVKAFMVMSLIVKHLAKFPKDENTGLTTINLAEIQKAETPATPNAKEPFRMDEFPELVKLGYIGNIAIKSSEAVYTNIKSETFLQTYRLQRAVMAINAANEQKRKGGGAAK